MNERIEKLNEQTALALIDAVDERVRSASDLWHATDWLIVGTCLTGLLVGQRGVPQWGWWWLLGYVLVGSLTMAVHRRRRGVERTPARWISVIWPATFVSTVVSGMLLDVLAGPRLSLMDVAIAAVPMVPGLAAVVWAHSR